MKRHLSDYTFLLTIAGLVVLLDQIGKHMVRTLLPPSATWAPWQWMLEYARFAHVQNTGAAFGMFQGMNSVFTILAIVVSIAILYYFPLIPREDLLIRIALSLQLGGALGNLIDRLARGYVTDYIALGSFAVFNIADASISIGTVLLLLGMWLKERKIQAAKRQIAPSADSENPSQVVPEEAKGE